MTGTSLSIIILFSILIALISLFIRPWLLMVLILISVYLLPRAGFLLQTAWYRLPLPAGYILIGSVILRWFFYLIFRRDRTKKEKPINKTFLLYIFIATLAVIAGFMTDAYIPVMTLEILFYFAAIFIYFIVIDIFEDKRSVSIFMTGILICGFLISLYGVLLLIYGKKLLVNYVTYNAASYAALEGQFISAKRTLSSYGDPNTLSAQLMVFCGIFISLLLQGRHNPLQKIFLLTGLILTILCIYFASSRASLIGLFVLFIVFAMTRIKKMWLYIPTLVVSYFLFLEPVRKYYEHRILTTGFTSDLRITYIKVFFDLLVRFPFGVGFGNTIDESYNLVHAYTVWSGFNSFYLQFFSKVGIQGLITFLAMLFLILRYFFKGFSIIEDRNVRYFVFGGACGIIVQQANFMANNVYHTPGGMLNFWVMCGMLTAIVNLYKSKL